MDKFEIADFDVAWECEEGRVSDFNILAFLPSDLPYKETEYLIKTNLPKIDLTCVKSEGEFSKLLYSDVFDCILRPLDIKATQGAMLEPIFEVIIAQTPGTDCGPEYFFFVWKDREASVQVKSIRASYGGVSIEMIEFINECIQNSYKSVIVSTLQGYSNRLRMEGNLTQFWEIVLKTVLV